MVVSARADRSCAMATVRLWVLILVANLAATLLFGLLAAQTTALSPAVTDVIARLGSEAAARPFGTVFWTAVVGGWPVALVAWLVTASTATTGQLAAIWTFTFLLALGGFTHSIAGSAEVVTAVLVGEATAGEYLGWLTGAVLGNAVGGVVVVALFNDGQVHDTAGGSSQE